METIREMKEKILDMTMLSYAEGLFAGTSGNLSMCSSDRKMIAITPSSIRYDTMTIDDIMIIGFDGTIIEGHHRPSSEWRMHMSIMQQKPEINAVVHTHSPYATSFAVTGTKIPSILIEMIGFLGGDVPVADFAMPGSFELGVKAIENLKNRNACLLSNHGVVAVGPTIEQAQVRAVYVEDAAKIYWLSLQTGSPRLVPDDALKAMKKKFGISD